MEFISDSTADIRSSLGYVKDWYNVDGKGQEPLNIETGAYNIFMDMWKHDTVISLAFDKIIEVTTYKGFNFVPRDGKYNKSRESEIRNVEDAFLNDFNFDEVMDNLLYQMCIYGDSYLELRRNVNGVIYELHPLETPEIRIEYNQHGEILYYIQKPVNAPKGTEAIQFDKDNIIHFRMKWVGSRVYSHAPLEPVAREWTTRRYANEYLKQIFRNLPPKILWSLVNASESQKQKFMNNVIEAKTNPARDVFASVGREGSVNAEILQYDFDSGLKEILKYLRQEVLIVTGIPPVWIGILESQRGDSEAQIMGFEMKIRKLQQKFESRINKYLLPELGFDNLNFKFKPISLKTEKNITEVARQFRDMGMNESGVMFYLRDNGFNLPMDTKLEDASNVKDEDLMLSRERDNKQTKDMGQNKNPDDKDRKMEVRTQTILPDNSKYW